MGVKTYADSFETGIGRTLEGCPASTLSLGCRRIMRLLRGLIGRGAGVVPPTVDPDPSAIADEIVIRARINSVDWGEGFGNDYPDRFAVSVSREAWESYYGRGAGIPERIASLAVKRMPRSQNGLRWEPVVSISYSDLLPRGAFDVSESFGPRELEGARRAGERVEDCEGAPSDATPPLAKTATLRFLSTSYPVAEGNTVGVARLGRDNPDIVLPTCSDLSYTSNIQGSFDYRDGHWVFTQLGRNRIRVSSRDGSDITLERGESLEMHDRDRIWMPGSSEPALFLSDARRSDGGTPFRSIPR